MRKRTNKAADRAARQRLARASLLQIKRAEDLYVRELRAIARGLHAVVERYLVPRLHEVTYREDSRPFGALVDLILLQATQSLRDKAGQAARKAFLRVEKGSKESAKLLGLDPRTQLSPGVATAFVDRNVALVQKLGDRYRDQVRQIFEDPATFGQRVETIKERLLERGDVSEAHAELVARDQTLKLNGQINEERQRAAGVDSYTWSTSLDDRVRPEHAKLEGQVIPWNNPPEPGHPGDDFQCRCVAIPILPELDDA